MEFLKKHYEKVLLSVVLLILAAAAGWLSIRVKGKQNELRQKIDVAFNPGERPLPPVDLATNEAVLARIQKPLQLELTVSNHVFNPMQWVKMPPPDEKVLAIKNQTDIGPGRLEVSNKQPLLLTITLETVTGTNDTAKFTIGIKNEAHPLPTERTRKITRQGVSLNTKNDLFIIRQAGVAANGEFTLTLEPLNKAVVGEENAVFSKKTPYTKVVGHTVDLRYPPEALSFAKRRKGETAQFDGDTYNIIAIGEGEITIQSVTTQKKYTVPIK